MPKQGTRIEVNTFVRGLVTEASPLNFPANASFDEVNFELNRDGTRQRRLGMDLEKDYYLHYATALNHGEYKNRVAGNSFIWYAPGGINDLIILVVQMGNQITLHRVEDKDTSISPSDKYLGVFTLTYDHNVEYSFTAINGKMVIAGGGTHVAVMSYTPTTKLFSLNYVPLRVRDIWGVQEDEVLEKDATAKPENLSDAHEYNLCNQGWGIPRKAIPTNSGDGSSGGGGGGLSGETDPIDPPTETNRGLVNPFLQYRYSLGRYPSNSEVVYSGLEVQAADGTTFLEPFERMYPNLYEQREGLTVQAARGYFIIELHNRGVSRRAAMDANKVKYDLMPEGKAYPSDYMTSGASVVSTYAGRVFYSGFTGEVIEGDSRSPVLTDYVFFSNLVRNDVDINACYQFGDPTSRESNEVVETDGGFLRILGAKKIVAMATMGKHLVVIATNGVWVVSGGNDYGFSATNYKVEKITSFGCIAPSSIVEVNNTLLYWGIESVYKLGYDTVGSLTADDFSSASINSYYDRIPLESKRKCIGVYDAESKKVRWIYRLNDMMSDEYYATELVFDTLLGCYYQHKIPGLFNTNLIGVFISQESGIKYIALLVNPSGESKYTFAEYKSLSFSDWESVDGIGVDAKAYLLTGAITAGDSGIDKQAPYLQLHFKRTETKVGDDGLPLNASSCMMRCQWEWSNSPKSKKFTDMVETYRYQIPLFVSPGEDYDNGFDTVITKTKLRGKGKAISLYFETTPYKDCQILGWNLTINGNSIT